MSRTLQENVAGEGVVVEAPLVVTDASSVNWAEEAGAPITNC